LDATTYTNEPLQTGLIYSYKVRARNIFGQSDFSVPVQILTAQIPDTVLQPTTEFDKTQDLVIVRWQEPFNRGSPLLGYYVYIQEEDGTFALETANCDGSDPTIMANLECSIPVNVLKNGPFSHPWGADINAYIIAYNLYG
jgi:hypothetical protein